MAPVIFFGGVVNNLGFRFLGTFKFSKVLLILGEVPVLVSKATSAAAPIVPTSGILSLKFFDFKNSLTLFKASWFVFFLKYLSTCSINAELN